MPSGCALLCVAVCTVTALVAPVAAGSSTWDGNSYINTLDQPSGGWTVCPAPVQVHLDKIIGWLGMSHSTEMNCVKTGPGTCQKLVARDLATTGNYNYEFADSRFSYGGKEPTGRVSKVPYISAVHAKLGLQDGGRDYVCRDGLFFGRDLQGRRRIQSPCSKFCWGNATVMTGMTTAKFLELCSLATPTAATACPDAIKSEAQHITNFSGSLPECNDWGQARTLGDSKADTTYRIDFPSCQNHTVVFTKHHPKMFQSCTADADCSFCNARCETQFFNRCEPKVGMGVVNASQNDCFTTTYHPGLSMAKLALLCATTTTTSTAMGSGTTVGTGPGSTLASTTQASTTPAPNPAPTSQASTPPPPPALLPKAPASTKHFVEVDVTMPYTEEQFSAADVRKAFKKAVASAAGTVPENVEIVSVQQARRRTSSVVVKTKILAKDEAALTTMTSTLGSGGALKTKLNAALSKEGLKESTSITPPATGTSAAARCTSMPSMANVLISALSLTATTVART